MTWQVTTDGRARLLRDTTIALRDSGWDVRGYNFPSVDLSVAAADVSFFVQVVDQGLSNFMPLSLMADYLRKDSRQASIQRGTTLVFVTNFYFPGLDLATLASEGLSLFHIDELARFGRLLRYGAGEPPTEALDARELLILGGAVERCRALSNHFKSVGDEENAIAWARRMLINNRKPVNCELFLMKLLIGFRRMAEAEAAGDKLLIQAPNNVECLRVMGNLAERRRDPAAAEMFRSRMARAQEMTPPVATSLDAILAKQRAGRG